MWNYVSRCHHVLKNSGRYGQWVLEYAPHYCGTCMVLLVHGARERTVRSKQHCTVAKEWLQSFHWVRWGQGILCPLWASNPCRRLLEYLLFSCSNRGRLWHFTRGERPQYRSRKRKTIEPLAPDWLFSAFRVSLFTDTSLFTTLGPFIRVHPYARRLTTDSFSCP